MDGWIIGLVAVVMVGLAVIIYGALRDRRRNQRAAAEMLAPPKRVIPKFSPEASPPHYLSELQARRPPPTATATELTEHQRAEVGREIAGVDTVTIVGGYLDPAFVTDKASGWAVLDRPRVLICGEELGTIREVLAVLEQMLLADTALVVLAPTMSDEVVATLAVNKVQQRLRVVAVGASDAERETAAVASGATQVPHSDLQSGYGVTASLGRCRRWVSSRSRSYVVRGPSEQSLPEERPDTEAPDEDHPVGVRSD